VEDAVPLDTLTAEKLHERLQPALTAVANLQRIQLNDGQLAEIRHGRPIRKPRPPGLGSRNIPPVEKGPPIEWAAIDAAGQLVALLAEKNGGELWPVRNFEL
jgi:tRNA U55 pseudouridine synthase TruB